MEYRNLIYLSFTSVDFQDDIIPPFLLFVWVVFVVHPEGQKEKKIYIYIMIYMITPPTLCVYLQLHGPYSKNTASTCA